MRRNVSTITGTILILLFTLVMFFVVVIAVPNNILNDDFYQKAPVSESIFNRDFDKKIIEKVYGNFNGEEGFSKWILSKEENNFLREKGYVTADVYELEVSLLAKKEIGNKIYLLTAANINEEMLSFYRIGAVIGFHLLEREGGEINVIFSDKLFSNVGSFGSFCSDCSAEAVLISKDIVAFSILHYGTGQGHTVGVKDLIGFWDDSVVTFFSDNDFYFDDSGSSNVINYSSVISFIENNTGDVYEINVVKEGQSREYVDDYNRQGDVIDVIYREYTYQFKDGKYLLVGDAKDYEYLWEEYIF